MLCVSSERHAAELANATADAMLSAISHHEIAARRGLFADDSEIVAVGGGHESDGTDPEITSAKYR